MPCHLLDVNVLIALVDPAHADHERAHDWFGSVGHRGFATCPITENGLLRIVGHPQYPGSPGPPSAVADALRGLRALPAHEFWPDAISLLDDSAVDATHLSHHARVTDTYLLALAVSRGGRLATLDRRLTAEAVPGGREALVQVG